MLAVVAVVPALLVCIASVYYYVSFARMIEARLHGERDRVLPRVFARPLELRRGQSLTEPQLIDRLNDIGYTQRSRADRPGEFSIDANSVSVMPRQAGPKAQVVRIVFPKPPPPPKPSGGGRALPEDRTASSDWNSERPPPIESHWTPRCCRR